MMEMMAIRMLGWVMILIEIKDFVMGVCTHLGAIPGIFSLLVGWAPPFTGDSSG